ncbi:MAG: hypothetical protein AMXMBFR7_52370 [Planctomycetota bacterium]
MNLLSREDEAQRIEEVFGIEDPKAMWDLLDRQLATLHNRAQLLLGLAGVVVTTTGFSGRLIAGTSALGQGLIIAGVALALIAAVVVVWGVLPIRWLTQLPGEIPEEWLQAALAMRDGKTVRYRWALVLLVLGLALYVGAIAVMLLNPQAHTVPNVR